MAIDQPKQTNNTTNESIEEPSKAYKYYVLGFLTLLYTFNFIDRQILSVLQEPMRAELGLSDTQLGLLQGITFALFYVTVGIPIARMADMGNRRNIVAIAVGVWSFMTAITGYCQNFVQLLLARIGVGIGEAGGSPPSHSMISDLFHPSERARALSIYSMGITFGIFLAYVFGGWVSDSFGWRAVFIALGVPGVIIAIIFRLSVKEPARGRYDDISAVEHSPSFKEVLAHLLKRKSFIHLSIAAALHAFVGYGIAAFSVSFFVRSHGISVTNLSEITLPLGIIIGITGIIGNYAGGYLADRWGQKDKRWYLWVPAASTILAVPFAVLAFLNEDKNTALMLYVIPLTLGNMYLGPSLAITHTLVTPRMRALSSAILFFIINLIGLGLGPIFIGLTSDALSDTYGSESLRYAIIIAFAAYAWCAFHYFWASRFLIKDLE